MYLHNLERPIAYLTNPSLLMTNSFYLVLLLVIGVGCVNVEKRDASEKEDRNKEQASENANEEPATQSQDSIILFFGNSLTAGYGIELSQAFPALIQDRIDSLNLPYEIRNSGLSGETSAGGDSRVEFVLNTLKQPLAVFVLELGANDGLRGIDVVATRKHLQSIIEKVRSQHPHAEILLCGMEAPPNMGEEFTQSFRSLFPELAETHNTALVPFLLEGVGGESQLNLPDGIHPTPEGHKILADNVWVELKKLLYFPAKS